MKRAAAGAAARAARELADPRTAHESTVTAERLALEAEDHCEHLHGDEQLIEGILPLIHYLGTSKHKSDTRRDVMSHLKAAAGLLYLEIGTPEPQRDFDIVEPDTPDTKPETRNTKRETSKQEVNA